MARQKLTGLKPQSYEHPGDAAALNALQNTAGLDTVVRKLNSWGFERLLRVQLTGSYLKTTPDSFPDLHAALQEACEVLYSPIVPDLYIAPGPINALTAGTERPLIILNSMAIDLLTADELFFVLAHEVGHIKSAHVLYYQIAQYLPFIAEILGSATFGLGDLLSVGLQAALLRFQRQAEHTADRAGLLACQDAEVAIRVLMKLAGLPTKSYGTMNTEDFITQAREFQALDADTLSLVAKWLSTVGSTHPWTVVRAQELLKWIDSGEYDQLLKNPERRTVKLPTGVLAFCGGCGAPLRGMETFCPRCGKPAPPIPGLVKGAGR